jgi:hypothetical protein
MTRQEIAVLVRAIDAGYQRHATWVSSQPQHVTEAILAQADAKARYLRRYRSKGVAMRRRAAGKRA